MFAFFLISQWVGEKEGVRGGIIDKCEQRFECKNKNHCIIKNNRYRIPILGMKVHYFIMIFIILCFIICKAEGKTGCNIY